MNEKEIELKIKKNTSKQKDRIEFIIFLLLLIGFLYFYYYKINYLVFLKDYVPKLIILFEVIYLIFVINIQLTTNKLKKYIKIREKLFQNKLMNKTIDPTLPDIKYNSEKGISKEEIDRIDILSKDSRSIITNNLIEGTHHTIDFKSSSIIIKDKKNTYTGRWIVIDTTRKESMSFYVTSKNTYEKDLLYPKKLYDKYKFSDKGLRKKYIAFEKSENDILADKIIDLKMYLKKDIYVGYINNKINIFIITELKDDNIKEQVKEILSYIEIISKYKESLYIGKPRGIIE